MDNLYNVVYNLVNDINEERNAINDFFYTSNLIVGDMFSVNNGLATFNIPVDINYTVGNLLNPFDYALYVVGGVYIGKNLYVNGNIISNDDIVVYGNLEIVNLLNVKGNAVLGNMYLYSNAYSGTVITKNINADYIYGNIYNLKIVGEANLDTLYVKNMDLINIGNVIGNQMIVSNLYSYNIYSDNINANIINITDKLTGNYLIVNNESNIFNLNVYGSANISGNVNISGSIKLLGNLYINNLFKVDGNIDVYGNLNLYNANVTLYNDLVANNDTFVNGNLYCYNIIADGQIISNINDLSIESNVKLDLYGNSSPPINIGILANLDFLRENKACCIRSMDNITGKILSSCKYIYANLDKAPVLNQYIPNVPINKDMNLTDGTNIGYNYLISGNIAGNTELVNLYFPDYIASNSPCIRFERFNRKDFLGNIMLNQFSISYII